MTHHDTGPRSFTADQLHVALADVAGPARPDYLTDIVAAAGRTRQRPAWTFLEQWRFGRGERDVRIAIAFVSVMLLALLVIAGLSAGTRPTPHIDLGIFEPLAGRIVYGTDGSIFGVEAGIWGLDPTSADPAGAVRLTAEAGTPLGWSADGTRLLLQKDREHVFILHADGSETKVTERLSGIGGIPGSSPPAGATISPDGSRVIFAGLTVLHGSCHDGALFTVDADG